MTNIEKKGYQPVVMRIYNKDRQLVLEDEVLCAYDTQTKRIQAMGKEAYKFIEDNQILVENPMKWGVVADYLVFEKIVEQYVKKAMGPKALRKPHIVMCVPAKLTPVEETTLLSAFMNVAIKRKKPALFMKSYQQVMEEKLLEDKKAPDLCVELVSDYYASEYFE